MKAQDTFAFLWIPILLHCIKQTRTQEVFFSISRTRPHGDDGWTNGVDRFNIPSTMCPQNPHRTCAYFSGSTVGHDNCTCECLSTKTTFAFTDGRWKCQSNANNEMQARLQSVQYSKHDEKACSTDMATLFVDEHSNSNLKVLDEGDEKAVSITSDLSNCVVDTNHSWYFGCNDSRLSSPRYINELSNIFQLEKGNNDHNLKVVGSAALGMMQGRIINLGIACKNGTTTVRHCILFKLQGTIECPVPIINVTTSSIKLTTQAVSTSSPHKQPSSQTLTSEVRTTVSSNQEIPGPTTYKKSPASSTAPASTTVVENNDTLLQISTLEAPRDQKQSSHETSMMPLPFIASVTVSSVLLIAFLIGVIIIRRNFASESNDTDKDLDLQGVAVASTLSNLAIPSLDEHGGYFTLSFRDAACYASTYQVPRATRKSSIHDICNPMGEDPDATHLYEPIDGSNAPTLQNCGPVSREQLVYNLVEEMSAAHSANNGTNNSHNISVTTAFHSDGPISHEQPVYNLVEDISAAYSANDGANNSHNIGTTGGFHSDGPLSHEQHVYNLVEEIIEDHSANNGSNNGHNIVFTEDMYSRGIGVINFGFLSDPCETDSAYRVIEEVVYRSTEISPSCNDNASDEPVYCIVGPLYEDLSKSISEC